MINLVFYILFFAIYSVLLFYGNSSGLNYILYNLPALFFSIIVLYKNKKIKNKFGLLFSIPIVILSISNLFYNSIFTKFNIIVIPLLFIFMYIYTIKPTYKFVELLLDTIRLIFKKFYTSFIRNYFNIVSLKLKGIINLKKESKKRIISFLIVLPIILFILLLLISADMEFKNLFSFVFDAFSGFNIFDSIIRIVLIIIEFILIGSFLNYLLYRYGKENYPKNNNFIIEPFTIKLLLIILTFVYVVFDIIQIKSLFFHQVDRSIVYSQYARTGFFQLMFVSILNIIILLLSKKTKESGLIKNLSFIVVVLTFIIICSSFYRMYLYDMAYGYTVLRLLVYATLITETILLVPTLLYIYNSKIKIVKHYMIITLAVYTLLNLYSIDKIIAKNNIDRYSKVNKIDINYLVHLSYDDIPEIYTFYKNLSDPQIKNEIRSLVCEKYIENNSYYRAYIKNNRNVFEYNFGRDNAYKIISNFKCSGDLYN